MQVYSDCECISNFKQNKSADPLIIPDLEDPVPMDSAIKQKCPSVCNVFWVFVTAFFIIMLLTFLITMPTVVGTLRFVCIQCTVVHLVNCHCFTSVDSPFIIRGAFTKYAEFSSLEPEGGVKYFWTCQPERAWCWLSNGC